MKEKQERIPEQPLINIPANGRLFLKLFACLLLLSLTAVLISTVHATDITITTTDDELNSDGDCSLREAVVAANGDTAVDACPAGNGADTIVLPAGEFLLNLVGSSENASFTGDLDITDDLTLIGVGANDTFIDANDVDRVFELHSGSQVTMSNLTVRGGAISSAGANIRVAGLSGLTLQFVRISEAAVDSSSAIYVVSGSSLNVFSSRIENNLDGGMYIQSDVTANIHNSTISGNQKDGGGGGFNIEGGALVSIINSTISGNSATTYGGGILNAGVLGLYNVTVANNVAGAGGPVSEGGGIANLGGTVTLRNSILADNEDLIGSAANDCSGTVISEGYNLIETTTGCTITGDTVTNITGIDPNLDVLSGNGGGTQTHPLLAGSPAINAGNPVGCRDASGALLTTDQRAFLRNGDCDLGAFEANSPGSATATPTLTPTATNTFPPTNTATPTATPMSTSTSTQTPLATSTSTPTRTPTSTLTPSATGTQTPTVTGTIPPTATIPSTATPTPTGTLDPPQTESFFVYLPFIVR